MSLLGLTMVLPLLLAHCLSTGEGRRLFTVVAVKSRLGFSLQIHRPTLNVVHPKHLPAGSDTRLSAEVWAGASLSSWEPQTKGSTQPLSLQKKSCRVKWLLCSQWIIQHKIHCCGGWLAPGMWSVQCSSERCELKGLYPHTHTHTFCQFRLF